MQIVSCPKCGRPRVAGQPCPICGDTTAQAGTGPETPTGRAGQHDRKAPITPASARPQRATTGRPQRKAERRSRRGLVATIIAAVVVEEASLVSTPDRGYDQAAQSLLRNAMSAMDAAFVESGDYSSITQATLEAMEPAIDWVAGHTGVCGSPPAGATAQANRVAWAATGRLSYELGTWSESGTEFGVKVDKAGGGVTQYRGGVADAW